MVLNLRKRFSVIACGVRLRLQNVHLQPGAVSIGKIGCLSVFLRESSIQRDDGYLLTLLCGKYLKTAIRLHAMFFDIESG